MKSSVVGDGSAGVQDRPQKFWFAENLGKISENPGKNSTHRCLTSKKKRFAEKHMNIFLEVTPKKVIRDLYWKKFAGKSGPKNFSVKFGEIRAYILFTPKILPAPTRMKRHFRPRCPPFERSEAEMPRHASIFRGPCAYYPTRTLFARCWLQCVTAMNINYQRSPKTEQFITAKISGNVLKTGK